MEDIPYITLLGNYCKIQGLFTPHLLSVFYVLRIVLGTKDTKINLTLLSVHYLMRVRHGMVIIK